ncbi:MAG: hypothetical protein ABJB12_03900 [Pseudomonadota bacterium]
MSDTVLVAYVAATAGVFSAVISALISYLMNQRLRNQIESHEREQAAHESTLRVQAEVSLSMHEKSWSLIRELTAALYDAQREIARCLQSRGKGEATDFSAAVAAVSRVEMLTASVPPDVDLAPVLKDLNDALFDTNFLGVMRSVSEIGSSLLETSKTGRQVIASWNARLWESARRFSTTPEGTK